MNIDLNMIFLPVHTNASINWCDCACLLENVVMLCMTTLSIGSIQLARLRF